MTDTIPLSNILIAQDFKVTSFESHYLWFKAPNAVVIDPIVGDHSASDLILFTHREKSTYPNVSIEGQLELIMYSIGEPSSKKIIFNSGAECLSISGVSTLTLPHTKTHLSSLSLYNATLNDWSSKHRESNILLVNSSAQNLTIEKCNSLVVRNSYIDDVTMNVASLIAENCNLRAMNLVSHLPRLSLDHTNFDDTFISEPIYGATLASQKGFKNLAGDYVQAMIYCSVRNEKLETLVEVGCWDGTIEEFRALLDSPAKHWPSFDECSTAPSKKRLAKTRRRYLKWLERCQNIIDQEFKHLSA